MEAYPHLQTVRRMTTHESQLYPGSMTLDFHNKGIFHERRMATYVSENFRQHTQDVATYTHLTQVVQAESMRAAYKMWRRGWRDRKCGGVLVWQLNDCWPTMSWAVVDYYLLPKPAFYAIARALRPIDIGVVRTYHDWTQTTQLIDEPSGLRTGQIDQTAPARSGSTYDVWIASSRVEEVPSAEVVVRFISVRTGKDITPSTRKANVIVAGNTTTDVVTGEELVPSIPSGEEADSTIPFNVDKWDPYVVHATLYLGGQEVASDTAWPEPIKFLDMSDRDVSFNVSPAKDEITITAAKPVKGLVFEELEGVKLSDNGLDVMPGCSIVVKVDGAAADSLKWTCVGEAPSQNI